MDVAVITPTVKGREDLLERCIESVRRAWIHYPIGDLRHVTRADENRTGPSLMRNLMVADLPGHFDWLLLLDDDDEIDEDFFRVLEPYLAGHEVVTGWARVAGDPPIEGWSPNRRFDAESLATGPNFLPVTTMIRRKAWERVGGMRVVAYEDHDLWKRLIADGARFYVTDEPIWTYHFHQGQHYSGRVTER